MDVVIHVSIAPHNEFHSFADHEDRRSKIYSFSIQHLNNKYFVFFCEQCSTTSGIDIGRARRRVEKAMFGDAVPHARALRLGPRPERVNHSATSDAVALHLKGKLAEVVWKLQKVHVHASLVERGVGDDVLPDRMLEEDHAALGRNTVSRFLRMNPAST